MGNTFANTELQQFREENRRLRIAIEELSILNELARVISSTMSLNLVIENIIKRSVKAVHCYQGMITLVDEIVPGEMKTLIRTLDSSSNHTQFHLNQNILGWTMKNKKPLVSNNFSTDVRFSGVKIEGDIHSLLCVPLIIKNRLIGILAVFNKKENGLFNDDELRLLSIIAAQSAQVIENARLYEEEKKKISMEKELIAAREVQLNLLPKQLPHVAGYEFAAQTIPAKKIGGDFYDIVKTGDNSYQIIIADVAGKGLPAALLATLGKGILCSQVMQHRSLQTQLRECNQILRRSVPHKSFITLLLASVQLETNIITLANAGHCYPLFYQSENKVVETITVKGMALNLTDEIQVQERTLMMKPGDCILLYSDGVDEAQNITQECFGIDRLTHVFQQYARSTAEMLLQKIIEEIRLFSKGVSPSDDITLFVLKAK